MGKKENLSLLLSLSIYLFPLHRIFYNASHLTRCSYSVRHNVAGNFFPYRVQSGQCAASFGLLLKGLGNGNFKPLDPMESGCYMDGDVRSVKVVADAKGEKLVWVGKNNDAVQVLKINR